MNNFREKPNNFDFKKFNNDDFGSNNDPHTPFQA